MHSDTRGYELVRKTCTMESVPLHLIATTVVEIQANVVRIGGSVLQVEVVAGHRGEVVAVDAHSCDIVAEMDEIDRHRIGAAGGEDLHGGGEARDFDAHRGQDDQDQK